MRILARIQQMASSEILAHIPASTYARIKEADSRPVFRAYVIGHEGVSEGRVVGEGGLIKRWYASAIKGLYDKLKMGIKLFHGHAETNEHEGRTSIGEIVGKALKDIGDRLTAIAIAYIKPEFTSLPLDVASIEATVRLSEDDDGISDTDVGDITGIALGNSAINQPGFAGATLLAQVQAFASTEARHSHGGETMEHPLDEIRQLIKAQKAKPSDLFGIDDLADDPAMKGYLETVKRNQYGAGAAHLRRTEEEFEKQKKDWQDKLDALTKEVQSKNIEIASAKIPEAFSKMAKERRLTEKQTKYIEKRLKRFRPSAPDKVESELAKHLDSELDDYKSTIEVLGVKDESPAQDKADGDKGTGPDEKPTGKHPGGIEDKYLDPARNPFIRPV